MCLEIFVSLNLISAKVPRGPLASILQLKFERGPVGFLALDRLNRETLSDILIMRKN